MENRFKFSKHELDFHAKAIPLCNVYVIAGVSNEKSAYNLTQGLILSGDLEGYNFVYGNYSLTASKIGDSQHA